MQTQTTLATRLLQRLARLCDTHGPLIVALAAVVFVLSVYVTVRRLQFETDRNALIGSDAPYFKTYQAFKKEFPAEDDMVVLVAGPKPERNREVVLHIGKMLRSDPKHFTDVYDRVDLGFVRQRLLLYMDVADLKDLQKRLHDVAPFMTKMLARPGLVGLFGSIEQEIHSFIDREMQAALQGGDVRQAGDSKDAPDLVGSLPVLATMVGNMAATVGGQGAYKSPWAALFAPSKGDPRMQEIPKEIYLEFQDGGLYLVLVKPNLADPKVDLEDCLGEIRRKLDGVRAAYPRVEIGLTGEPVLEIDEMQNSERDSERATLISLVGVVALFVWTFGALSRPLLATLSLVLALGPTMGYTTLAIGHLNIITVTCMPMLIGLGIDFGIQVISRYEEERLAGLPPQEAMVATLGGTGSSVVLAGFTTAVSFFASRFTGFLGIGELGEVAGVGLLLSVVAMLVVLPSLLLWSERVRMRRRGDYVAVRPSPLQWLAGWEAGLLEHPWAVLLIFGLVSGVCVRGAFDVAGMRSRVDFDDNLLHLQSVGIESVEWIQRLDKAGAHSVLFAAVGAKDIEEARVLEAALKKIPEVADVESAVPLFPEHQEEKLALIPEVQRALAALPRLHDPLPPVDMQRLGSTLASLRSLFFLVYPEARKADIGVARQLRGFVLSTDSLFEQTDKVGAEQAAQRLHAYQQNFFRDLGDKLELLRGQGPPQPMTVQALPYLLRKQLIGRSGRLLLRVFPRDNIWEGKARTAFIAAVEKAVAPTGTVVTGSPIMMAESTRLLKESYLLAGKYAFVVICVLVFLHFFSVRATLLALLPLLVGLLWMLGIMAAWHIPFNPANYMVLPLILGIGVANGIYIVRRFQEEGSASVFAVSTGRAILLSNLTAMIGFVSLTMARYQGIMTLGLVMTLGIATCSLASLLVLPVTLKTLDRLGVRL